MKFLVLFLALISINSHAVSQYNPGLRAFKFDWNITKFKLLYKQHVTSLKKPTKILKYTKNNSSILRTDKGINK